MDINLGRNDMYQASGGVAGAVIVIHSNNAMSFPEDFGTVLTPGVYNAIVLSLWLLCYHRK